MSTATSQAPTTFEDAAQALAAATAAGQTVRIVGCGTKLGWGNPASADVELHTTGLDAIVEHNAGDLTATLEAGVPLAVAQRTFAGAGQMLALDPPLGDESGPTIGGVVATGDSGPLRHRYGDPRDLVVGATVVLSDGTIARAGGKVIKNVAGYDLAKLFSGCFGTLGMILSVNVRLHPRNESSATAVGAAGDPAGLAAAAIAVAAFPVEFEAVDIAWHAGEGRILARCAGRGAPHRAQRTARLMREHGLEETEVSDDDEALWERQRQGQRSSDQMLVRIAATPSGLADVLTATDACDGRLVGRAALGTSFVEIEPSLLGRLRERLPPAARVIVLDSPETVGAGDRWGTVDPSALELMRRVKARFDPAGTCNPGVFVGGI